MIHIELWLFKMKLNPRFISINAFYYAKLSKNAFPINNLDDVKTKYP